MGAGRAGLQDRLLVRELGPQLLEELGVELLPGVQSAEADPFLAPVEAGDTFRRRADQGEGESLAGLKRQARESRDVRMRQLLVRILAVLALDRPELALVGLGNKVDTLVGRRQLQFLSDGWRNLLQVPDAFQLRPVKRGELQEGLRQILETVAFFLLRETRPLRMDLAPRGAAGDGGEEGCGKCGCFLL